MYTGASSPTGQMLPAVQDLKGFGSEGSDGDKSAPARPCTLPLTGCPLPVKPAGCGNCRLPPALGRLKGPLCDRDSKRGQGLKFSGLQFFCFCFLFHFSRFSFKMTTRGFYVTTFR